MMKMITISPISRVHDTCMLFKAFQSVERSISSKVLELADQETNFERKLKTHIEAGNISDALKLFEESRKESLVSWTVEGTSSLLHMFMLHGEHKAVDRLYADMKRNVSYIGEGAKTTMIKSYCNRQQFDEAIQMLHSMTNENMIHHTRHYDYLIKSLAQNGQIKTALHLFDEKCKLQGRCYASKGDRSLAVDKEMIASLLNPNNISQLVPGKYYQEMEESNLECDIVNGHQNTADDINETESKSLNAYNLYGGMSLKVFHYLQHCGVKVPRQLLQVINTWLSHDPYYHWSWKSCKVSVIGLCSNCGNQLTFGISPSDLSCLESEIIKLSCSVEENVSLLRGKRLDKRACNELEEFKHFVKAKGPFDVIIDGLNVGLHGSMANRQNMVFSTDRLEETTKYFVSQKKKVLLIIRQKALVWKKAQDFIANLEKVCSIYPNKFNNDDLYLLYAAAFSGMQHVQIVTNDRLRDHRLLLPVSLWWVFLRWTRLNCVSFTTSDNGKLKFARQNFDPVVQRAGNSWHFPVRDGTWRCATRTAMKFQEC
ncbi:mitochondrial ribonuclease P catalytic subunit-like [Montipora foliosa]|uniref:mitochondrial ribonuclease P catalytic subunit-like n=1 Tax=Montipora foliosa TaxID=591990 RepID=UPI0035F1B3A5